MNGVSFNLQNFFIFLIELGFSILFLILFSCVHYGITKSTKLGLKIEKSKIWNFWYFFIFGFILALITFIVSSVSAIAIGDIGMPLTIIGLIYAMTIFYNKSVQIGALIPTILWVLFEYNGFTEFNLSWLLRIIIILIIAIVAITTTYIKWKPWPTFLLSCLTTLIFCLILLLILMNENTLFNCVILLISIISTIFYYAIIRYINKVLTRVSTMAREGAYVNQYYLIPTVLNEYFYDFVQKHNISQALVVTFDIKGGAKIKSFLLEQIHNLFVKDKALLFKTKYDNYGVLLSGDNYNITKLNKSYLGNQFINRNKDDDLYYLEQKIKKMVGKNNKTICCVSVYGVHSYDLDKLLENNQYILKHNVVNQSQNIIQLFNTNVSHQEIVDHIAFSMLSQKVNLNDIDVELEVLQLRKNKERAVCPRFYWPKLLTCDSRTILEQFDKSVGNTLLRCLAIKSLEKYVSSLWFNKLDLLIYYPIDILNNSTWSTTNLINKIKLFGINPNMVTLSFNVSSLSYWPKQIISNLKSLEEHNQPYFLVDVVHLHGISSLHPKGIILDPSAYKKKSNIKLLQQNKFNIL